MYHMQYTQYGHCYDLKHNNATMCIDVNNVRCTCIPRQIFTGEQALGGGGGCCSALTPIPSSAVLYDCL